MFTSGTTARPRAVRITHRNIQANTDSIIEYLRLTREDRMMAILPFYYCFGTSLLHTHLRVGGSVVLSNTFTFPETVLDLIDTTHCTGFAGVPSTYQTLLRNTTFPKRKDSPLQKVQQAGGKLPVVLIEELQRALPKAEVFIMYGQTEATARLSYLPPELLRKKMGSVGRGIPGVTLSVIGDDVKPVRPGVVGQIFAQGDNISPGYLDEPAASEQKFVHGGLMTGDLATVDDDGFIFIVDRVSDFIKSFGYRVSSQQVEACVMELPEVVSAAAVGISDLARGEATIVWITGSTGAQLTSADVMTHCTEKLARHMVPAEVRVIDKFPMSSQGKLLKTELRKLAAEVRTES